MRALRTLAHLFSVTEAETPAGGRTRFLEPEGDLWLAVLSPVRNGDAGGDGPPLRRERTLAETRSDPRPALGQWVRIRGDDWRVVLVDRDAPRMGRMTLTLERDLP